VNNLSKGISTMFEEIEGQKLLTVSLAPNKNVINLIFENNIELEIWAIPEDGTLSLDLVQFKMVRDVVKRTHL
jgi:hypothetical protein